MAMGAGPSSPGLAAESTAARTSKPKRYFIEDYDSDSEDDGNKDHISAAAKRAKIGGPSLWWCGREGGCMWMELKLVSFWVGCPRRAKWLT